MRDAPFTSSTDTSGQPIARWNRDWVKACVIGELIGFIPPAATGAALVVLDASEIVLVAGLVAAGVVEGLVLGRAQGIVLRQLIPGVTGWAEATGAAAGLAWLAGMGGSSLVGSAGAKGLILAVPGWIIGLLAMGVLQSWRLRSVVPGAKRWIPATTFAWLIGVAIPVVALSVVPNQWPPSVHILVAIPAAVAMGATVGAITGRTLNRFVEQSGSHTPGGRR